MSSHVTNHKSWRMAPPKGDAFNTSAISWDNISHRDNLPNALNLLRQSYFQRFVKRCTFVQCFTGKFLSLQYLRYLPISQKSNSLIFHLMPLVRKCNVVYEIVNVISAAGHQKSHSLRVKWQQTTQFLDVIVTDLSGVLEILACHSSFQKERGQLWYVPAWGIDAFLHNHPHHFLEF